MDTLPYAEIDPYSLPDRNGNDRNVHIEQLAAIPDCNGDGYDDWAVCFQEHRVQNAIDGVFVFFGSEEPDWEPDLELEGHRRLWTHTKDIAGGDFNNDGLGDLVIVHCNSEPLMGEIHIHFGSPWMDVETDVFINSEEEYNMYFPLAGEVGAVGDYNGDGVDDFVVTCPYNEAIDGGYYVVLAGNEDWEVGVKPEQEPVPGEFSLDVYPNPFNNEVKISFNNPTPQNLTLKAYNIQGREMASLWNGMTSIGRHETVWTADKAGVYFIAVCSKNRKQIRKIIYLP